MKVQIIYWWQLTFSGLGENSCSLQLALKNTAPGL